jgi:hypothetical protein
MGKRLTIGKAMVKPWVYLPKIKKPTDLEIWWIFMDLPHHVPGLSHA